MGIRTKKDPEVSDSFLWRICHALDEPPRMLAKNIGVEFHELAPLLDGERWVLAEVDRDHVWLEISAYVDRKTAMLMAVREELTRALHKERVRRATKLQRTRKYYADKQAECTAAPADNGAKDF